MQYRLAYEGSIKGYKSWIIIIIIIPFNVLYKSETMVGRPSP